MCPSFFFSTEFSIFEPKVRHFHFFSLARDYLWSCRSIQLFPSYQKINVWFPIIKLLQNYSTVQQHALERVVIQWLELLNILPALEEGWHCHFSSLPGDQVCELGCVPPPPAFTCTLEIRLVEKALLTHRTNVVNAINSQFFSLPFKIVFASHDSSILQWVRHSAVESLCFLCSSPGHSLSPGDTRGTSEKIV